MNEHDPMSGALTSQITSAALVVYLIQTLKRMGWYSSLVDRLPMDNAKIHRLVSALGAFASAVGVHIAFTGSATAGWHFAGTIPPLVVLLHAAWDWGQQFAINQVLYDMVAQKAGGSLKGVELSTLDTVAGDTIGRATKIGAWVLPLILGAGLLVSSCATLAAHDPFQNPDGSLNVPKIVDWVEYGIEGDCALGSSAVATNVCVLGRDGVVIARAAIAKDPTHAAAAVNHALLDWEMRLPTDTGATVKAYFNFAIQKLGGHR